MKSNLLTPLLFLIIVGSSAWADWPQYRGPQSDGTTTEALSGKISLGEPQWKIPLNTGFSSFVASGDLVFTVVRRTIEGNEHEMLLALETSSGKERWASSLSLARYDGGGDKGAEGNRGGDGPRSTPAVADGKVFVIDAALVVQAFDLKSGKPVWKHNVIREYKGRSIRWKNAASPLLEGGLLYMAGGGPDESFLAFEQATGDIVWKTGDALMTHATPIAVTIHGQRQILFFNQKGITSFTADKGEQLWHHEFPYQTSSAASPVVFEDIVYCSAGYGVGSTAFRVSADGKTEELWRVPKNEMANHWSTPVCKDGYLYGLFGFKKYGDAPLSCYDIKTSELKWQQKGFGPGHLTLAGNHLIVLGDVGQLVIVEADPSGYKEIARRDVLDGKCWTTPILSDGKIFARSAQEGVCLLPQS